MRAGPVGRLLRGAAGMLLVVLVAPLWFRAGDDLRIGALSILAGLAVVYHLVGVALSRAPSAGRPWIVSCCVLLPWVAVYVLGSRGGPLLGAGEGQLAALTYLGPSFLVVAARADRGCEVLALSGLLLGRRSQIPCLLFHPADRVEDRWRGESPPR